jgi:hypothetical protein
MKKGVGSISQRYRSGDPDPHQNVTDPQNCLKTTLFLYNDENVLSDLSLPSLGARCMQDRSVAIP